MSRTSQAWIYLDAGYGKVAGDWTWWSEVPALAVGRPGSRFDGPDHGRLVVAYKEEQLHIL